jgi:hypothetical protein
VRTSARNASSSSLRVTPRSGVARIVRRTGAPGRGGKDRRDIEKAEHVGFVDGTLEPVLRQHTGQVRKRSCHGRDGDGAQRGDVRLGQMGVVHVDARASAPAARGRHLVTRARVTSQVPRCRRAPVAEHCPVAAGQDRRHAGAVRGQRAHPDGVDAAMDPVQ